MGKQDGREEERGKEGRKREREETIRKGKRRRMRNMEERVQRGRRKKRKLKMKREERERGRKKKGTRGDNDERMKEEEDKERSRGD